MTFFEISERAIAYVSCSIFDNDLNFQYPFPCKIYGPHLHRSHLIRGFSFLKLYPSPVTTTVSFSVWFIGAIRKSHVSATDSSCQLIDYNLESFVYSSSLENSIPIWIQTFLLKSNRRYTQTFFVEPKAIILYLVIIYIYIYIYDLFS